MNLIKGKIVLSPEERDAALDTLENEFYAVLKNDVLNVELVLNACDTLSKSIGSEHIDLLINLGVARERAVEHLQEAKALLKRENLLKRLKAELGEEYSSGKQFVIEGTGMRVKEKIMPLGTSY
jgi:hypothetical protein